MEIYQHPEPQVLLEAILVAREAVAGLLEIQAGDSRAVRYCWMERHHELGRCLIHYANRLRQERLEGKVDSDASLYYDQAVAAHRSALRALAGCREPDLEGRAYLLIGRAMAEQALAVDQTILWLKKAIRVYQQGIKACPLQDGPQVWAELQHESATAWQWITCCAECRDNEWIDAWEAAMHCYGKIYEARGTVHDRMLCSACINLCDVMTELGKSHGGADRKELWRAAEAFGQEALSFPDSVRGGSDDNLYRGLRKLRRLQRWAL